MAHLRIGSRGSQLALWQANHVSSLLHAQGHTVDIEIIKTTGDNRNCGLCALICRCCRCEAMWIRACASLRVATMTLSSWLRQVCIAWDLTGTCAIAFLWN